MRPMPEARATPLSSSACRPLQESLTVLMSLLLSALGIRWLAWRRAGPDQGLVVPWAVILVGSGERGESRARSAVPWTSTL